LHRDNDLSNDRGLVTKRDQVLEGFRDACKTDPRVLAAFVGGSVAAGTADRYSDLDLYLVVDDSDYDGFFADRRKFLCHLGEPVYLEDFSGFGFDMLLFILANGVKGELGLGRASGFSHIHGGPHQVLVDKQGILVGVTFLLFEDSTEQRRRKLVKRINGFWRALLLFTGAMGRRRPITASGYLTEARRELLGVLLLEADPAGIGGPPERLLSPDVIQGYSRTFTVLEEQCLVQAADTAVGLLRESARVMARDLDVCYPEALEDVVLREFRLILPPTAAEGASDPG